MVEAGRAVRVRPAFAREQRSYNPNGCFNWFQTGDVERGHGEALSIRQMVAKMVVMLATCPDVFAGRAIIAGLPYGAAKKASSRRSRICINARRAPRVSGVILCVVHPRIAGVGPRYQSGTAEPTGTARLTQLIRQTMEDVHGLPANPSFTTGFDGYTRQVWLNPAGDEIVESFAIPNMAHGAPLATGNQERRADEQCGAAGPFLLEVGTSPSYHIAKFFGLTNQGTATPAVRDLTTTLAPETPRFEGGKWSFNPEG